MSATANQVQSILNELFPANPHRRVFVEQYINFKGHRLFFDFFIKELSVFIEIQGAQHKKFVKHFHGTAENFSNQKLRDNLKIQYVQENNFCLARFYDTEIIDDNLVHYKINKAMEDTFYE